MPAYRLETLIRKCGCGAPAAVLEVEDEERCYCWTCWGIHLMRMAPDYIIAVPRGVTVN
jgi:hypothetical protein